MMYDEIMYVRHSCGGGKKIKNLIIVSIEYRLEDVQKMDTCKIIYIVYHY